jgi:hypothetical protein
MPTREHRSDTDHPCIKRYAARLSSGISVGATVRGRGVAVLAEQARCGYRRTGPSGLGAYPRDAGPQAPRYRAECAKTGSPEGKDPPRSGTISLDRATFSRASHVLTAGRPTSLAPSLAAGTRPCSGSGCDPGPPGAS